MSFSYQIVSLPLHSESPDVLDSEISNVLESKIASHGIAEVFAIGFPEFKVHIISQIKQKIGTLDSIVLSSDEIGKFALNVKSTHDFMISTMKGLLEEYGQHDPSSFLTNLFVENRN